MKTCVILGDLSSDRATEQYLTVSVCDVCIASNIAADQHWSIVNFTGGYNPYYGEQCYFCDTAKDELV
jgi:hypothetical protein